MLGVHRCIGIGRWSAVVLIRRARRLSLAGRIGRRPHSTGGTWQDAGAAVMSHHSAIAGRGEPPRRAYLSARTAVTTGRPHRARRWRFDAALAFADATGVRQGCGQRSLCRVPSRVIHGHTVGTRTCASRAALRPARRTAPRTPLEAASMRASVRDGFARRWRAVHRAPSAGRERVGRAGGEGNDLRAARASLLGARLCIPLPAPLRTLCQWQALSPPHAMLDRGPASSLPHTLRSR